MPRKETFIPNTFAYIALCGWPLVCLFLFIQLPLEKAAIWSLLAGYLLLPSELSINVHLLPPLDKSTIPAMTTFLFCAMKGGPSPAPRRPLPIYLFALAYVLSPIPTALGNSYELHIGDRSIPGFYPLDSVKLAAQNLITLAPLFVGMRYLSSDHAREQLLKAIIIASLLYTVPMLFELRMSPQLQRMVYGSAPVFAHLVRAGGYKPVVFLSNGIELALFTAMAFIAAVIAARLKWRVFQMPAGGVATYLGGILLLCKSLSTTVYGIAALPLVLLTKPRTWIRVSLVITLIICAYPFLRTYDIIPVNRVISATNSVSAERSGSFAFRVNNENSLLAKANQKPYFGWGTWGRNRVYDQQSGTDESITDGAWILRFGMFGWFGYLAFFGIFASAAFSAFVASKGSVTSSTMMLGALTLLLAVNLTDLIPNANLLPLTYVLAGSIAARARIRSKSSSSSKRNIPTVTSAAVEAAG